MIESPAFFTDSITPIAYLPPILLNVHSCGDNLHPFRGFSVEFLAPSKQPVRVLRFRFHFPGLAECGVSPHLQLLGIVLRVEEV
uniref:Phage terminase GpA n=1 Tax=uncultured marine virus TaxID=186617 RepID=A0A0F7L4J2_9VIRU|nr:phage terminase GpA [uncultured marine virus]